ncbi:putative VHS domain, CID domain, protein PCF11 [Septoria linicola]|nr:putative VHS domain, CID domain, protein PCF11 [Septoria linicola]
MSSRSPRGSISGGSSAEVAADFEESLKDLQSNNRYEISNLTVIAKENTEHAQAISRALENHIKTTSPTRKLPALFVLDSIVKNVGTPYTVYLGRNLYNTFMEAYTLVDTATRRHMDAMLRTWKEPVPGSIDPRPVFPRETVQPLENAMIKARAALEKIRQAQVPFQGTATPPQHNGQYARPPAHMPQPTYPNYGTPQPTPQQSQPFSYQPPLANLTNDIESVKRDIDSLIPRFQYQLATKPGDMGLQTQLNALNQLRNLLNVQRVTSAELQQIKQQVSSLAPSVPQYQQHTPQPQAPTPQWQAPPQFPLPFQPPSSAYPAAHQLSQPPIPPPSLPPDALNGLQALLSSAQKPSTPQLRAAVPGFQTATHSQLNAVQTHTAAAPSTNGAADLIASLTKAGLINPVPTSAQSAPLAVTAPPTMDLLKSLQGFMPPPSQVNTPLQVPRQPLAQQPGVPISAAALKVYRPELIASVYDALPNQCSTCGRRFPATDGGRQKKSLHLDWHFRTNQRIADPNTNRGHHRNWFPDEMEWIRHVEFDPSTTTANAVDPQEAAKAQRGPQEQFVRAPAGMTKSTCTICYEDLHSTYSEEYQDWVFPNAAYMNKKIVHATCLSEMTKSQPPVSIDRSSLAAALAGVGAGQRERSATPDSLLGKRKAESAMSGNGPRIKLQ